MREPVSDPNALRKALETVDTLKRELMKERMRSSALKVQLSKLRTTDAKAEQHAGR
jgi:hypothetical protein